MVNVLSYASAVAPHLKDQPDLVAELSDSVVVVVVARLDAFFVDVVSLGTRHRERTSRRHFAKCGEPSARSCDLRTVVKLVSRCVSFEDGGKRLDNLFKLMFLCSVWPSAQVRDSILDLVLLRNLIVHSAGNDWSQDGVTPAAYAPQFRKADVLDVRRYGDLAVYEVDRFRALLFVKEAALAVVEQLRYLEARLVRDMSWADSD